MAVSYPRVNGHVYDFSSVEITIDGRIYTAIGSISYNQTVEEGELRGAAAEVLARTRGQLSKGEGELAFSSAEEAQELIDVFGDGYLEKTFTVAITFSATGAALMRHELFGCRFLEAGMDMSQGTDPIGTAMPFSFLYMTRNGKTPLIGQRI